MWNLGWCFHTVCLDGEGETLHSSLSSFHWTKRHSCYPSSGFTLNKVVILYTYQRVHFTELNDTYFWVGMYSTALSIFSKQCLSDRNKQSKKPPFQLWPFWGHHHHPSHSWLISVRGKPLPEASQPKFSHEGRCLEILQEFGVSTHAHTLSLLLSPSAS